jgi:hypothetical protein
MTSNSRTAWHSSAIARTLKLWSCVYPARSGELKSHSSPSVSMLCQLRDVVLLVEMGDSLCVTSKRRGTVATGILLHLNYANWTNKGLAGNVGGWWLGAEEKGEGNVSLVSMPLSHSPKLRFTIQTKPSLRETGCSITKWRVQLIWHSVASESNNFWVFDTII